MSVRTILGIFTALVIFTVAGKAGGKEDLQKFFNDAATKVKASSDPTEKREILSTSLQTMTKALDMAQDSPLITVTEKTGIDRYKAALQEKQDELAGRNGFERVSDERLNDFSDYVVQDTEQAAEYITISIVTLLLILILIILIVK